VGKKKSAKSSISFEDALAKLEAIVQQLEDGQIGLTESLAKYEQGIGYLKQCHQALNAAEQKISLLTAVDEDGAAQLAPFDDETLSLDEKQAARSRRRSHQPPPDEPNADVDMQQGLF